ncbi:MAG: hypothetical protein K2K19_00050 [Acetatifactor sp.]|nr:hypothetical protein [Acetatifactor sp.]
MEEYEYLENFDTEELIGIIREMLDFEETTKALSILTERDMKSALELGKDIIINDKGDDHLQATVWDFLFFENQEDMLGAVEAREKEPGKALLNDVIVDLTDNKVNISSRLLKRLTDTYMSIDSEDKWYMYCDFEAFCRQYV